MLLLQLRSICKGKNIEVDGENLDVNKGNSKSIGEPVHFNATSRSRVKKYKREEIKRLLLCLALEPGFKTT